MMHKNLLASACLALAACGGGTVNFQGERIYDRFPLNDGFLRTWSFEADDTSLSYRMAATQLPDPEVLDDDSGVVVHTIEFTARCFNTTGFCVDEDDDGESDRDDEVLMSWRISSDSNRGIQFHGITVGTTETVYDPPVVLAEAVMRLGEEVETTSGGTTFTGKFEGTLECPAPKYWTSNPPKCVELSLDDGGAGAPVAGTFFQTGAVGPVAFELDKDEGVRWALKGFVSEEL